jgi:hypothetical protein
MNVHDRIRDKEHETELKAVPYERRTRVVHRNPPYWQKGLADAILDKSKRGRPETWRIPANQFERSPLKT